jgi:hypothetical protein
VARSSSTDHQWCPDVLAGLQLLHPAGVDLVRGHPVQEELVAEDPLGPAEPDVPAGVGDRLAELGGGHAQPHLLAQLAGGRLGQRLAVLQAAARGEPDVAAVVAEAQQQHAVGPVDEQDARGAPAVGTGEGHASRLGGGHRA